VRTGDIIVIRTDSLTSRFIQWWTGSEWSHVGMMISETMYIHAAKRGVKIGFLPSHSIIMESLTWIKPLTVDEQDTMKRFLMSKLDSPYDWRGLLSFVLRRNVSKKSWFFCSELVVEAAAHAGRVLVDKQAYWTTPKDIYQSDRLARRV
jgi:uncharacterized protein YycO